MEGCEFDYKSIKEHMKDPRGDGNAPNLTTSMWTSWLWSYAIVSQDVTIGETKKGYIGSLCTVYYNCR